MAFHGSGTLRMPQGRAVTAVLRNYCQVPEFPQPRARLVDGHSLTSNQLRHRLGRELTQVRRESPQALDCARALFVAQRVIEIHEQLHEAVAIRLEGTAV